MLIPEHIQAHKHSFKNRTEILNSEICGCFYCLAIFTPMSILEWTDDKDGIGHTALCPECGIDSVIGSRSGYPITIEFLEMMQQYWFRSK